MEVSINNKVYQEALLYAQQQGLSLPSVIENFLIRFIGKSQEKEQEAVPDIVLSLLGAIPKEESTDINDRDSYYRYLEEKYK